jgi:hypothetical protein
LRDVACALAVEQTTAIRLNPKTNLVILLSGVVGVRDEGR